MPDLLWEPSAERIERARLTAFCRRVEERHGISLPDYADLAGRIRALIRERATPRHVPARILAVDDIPYTRSGNKLELAVRDVVHGRPVSNREAIANPEALDHFRERPELSR